MVCSASSSEIFITDPLGLPDVEDPLGVVKGGGLGHGILYVQRVWIVKRFAPGGHESLHALERFSVFRCMREVVHFMGIFGEIE